MVIVGAGAAGLATAMFAAESAPGVRIVCLEGARTLGAKILVSGGGRCNVTNRVVTERDFNSGSPRAVRHVLRAFSAERTVALFEGLGVPLDEEERGKLFPRSGRARSVLDALLSGVARAGAEVRCGQRVVAVQAVGPAQPGGTAQLDGPAQPDGPAPPNDAAPPVAGRDSAETPGHLSDQAAFLVTTSDERHYRARAVVLATGGRSLPKSGSDGFGYAIARGFGHGIVETTPALVPLLLADDGHAALSGVAQEVSLEVWAGERVRVRLSGPLLWTHRGVSGPAVLDASRHWLRVRLDGDTPVLRMNLCAGLRPEAVDDWLLGEGRRHPRAGVATILASRLPAQVARWCAWRSGLPEDRTMSHLSREERARLRGVLTAYELPVTDSRGYTHAEVTAGGVPLDEVHVSRMESRRQSGLFLVGEILDVDGRLGGFNFQWAWSSAWVAGQAIGRLASSVQRPA